MRAMTLFLTLTLFSLTAGAASSHLVILKSQYNTANRAGSRTARYAHVRKVMDARFQQELKPFIAKLTTSRSMNAQNVVYLPIISGVAMNLDAKAVEAMKANSAVYAVIPNGRIELDRPSAAQRVTLPRTREVVLNEGHMLHGVAELMNAGLVDINKPGKTVGIIDTGVDGTHKDLAPKIIRFLNFANGSTTATDSGEHGTHVAGIIAGGNSSGTQLGVYPGAKLIVGSALGSYEEMAKALQWMLDPDGNPATADQPFVINGSWHIGSADATPFYIALQALKDADILMCFSAGNQGSTGITRPKEYPSSFSTAAVDVKGVIGDFSSWGPATYQGQKVNKPEVASIGVKVLSTLPGGQYGRMSGTSMASPFTAGAVALLGAHFPTLSPYVIAEALVETAERKVRAPWDKQYGYGMINVNAAFLLLKSKFPQ